MSNVFSGVCTVGRDAEVRHLPNGQAVLNVSVANNVGFGDKQQTVWLRVVLWGKRAEGTLKDYLKKGQQVFVSGELTMSEFTGNDGVKKSSLELNATTIDLVGKKSESQNAPANPTQQSAYQSPYQQHTQAVHNHQAQPYQQNYNQQPAHNFEQDIPF